MLDPLYLRLRPGRSRHPCRAKNGETKERKINVVRNDLPGIAAHTAAGGPKRVQDFGISTGLELRKRIALARFARSCAAPPLKNKPFCENLPADAGQTGVGKLLD